MISGKRSIKYAPSGSIFPDRAFGTEKIENQQFEILTFACFFRIESIPSMKRHKWDDEIKAWIGDSTKTSPYEEPEQSEHFDVFSVFGLILL